MKLSDKFFDVLYQPPSWDRYHVKLQEWNRFMTKGKSISVCADEVKAPIVEKPAMFAFCLKPRGLEVPNNGSKCRSQKKVHAAGRRHANIGEQGGFHSFGNRYLYSYLVVVFIILLFSSILMLFLMCAHIQSHLQFEKG